MTVGASRICALVVGTYIVYLRELEVLIESAPPRFLNAMVFAWLTGTGGESIFGQRFNDEVRV